MQIPRRMPLIATSCSVMLLFLAAIEAQRPIDRWADAVGGRDSVAAIKGV